MNISSRTPEGDPYLCAICGGLVVTETSEPLGDSVCPRCGALLTRFRDGWGGQLGVDPKHIRFDTRLAELGIDSLDTVELVMELEEDLDLAIPDEKARQMQTLADWIRWIRRGEEELGEQR